MSDQSSGLGELDAAFIAKQRARLEALQRELLGGEEGTIAKERALEEYRGEEANEFEDEAQRLEQDVANQALRNTNDQRIADIQRALEKIAEGTYGYSDESGDPIPIERLEAVPEAILTVQEQAAREARH
ncbi:TraR/DksA family transcriptional regulator [Paraburkholderia susongensis]|uniref:Transcriptional regulator, TraR/DksA family n=1 Tax=Paraburkholderia susongensis TaxID=1515439 RepID=A0A1X7LY58_9BURK|nr:TraR/DksA family transcriptional regulator [Paraburkholderia susongensis]SMG58856.1 transcriptional regulator, TraR/DksA family [Paraburkholderia susongensis]